MSADKTLAWHREHMKPVAKVGPLVSGHAAVETGWLIWSNEHCGWWKPNELGYTPYRSQAGRYSFDRALEICEKANRYLNSHTPKETMCPDWDVPAWGEEEER